MSYSRQLKCENADNQISSDDLLTGLFNLFQAIWPHRTQRNGGAPRPGDSATPDGRGPVRGGGDDGGRGGVRGAGRRGRVTEAHCGAAGRQIGGRGPGTRLVAGRPAGRAGPGARPARPARRLLPALSRPVTRD